MSQLKTLIDRNQSQLVSVEAVKVQGAGDYDDEFIRKQFSSVFGEKSFGATLKIFNKAVRRLQFLGLSSTLEFDVSKKSTGGGSAAVPIEATVTVNSAPSYWIDAQAVTRDDVAGLAVSAGNSNVIGGAETLSVAGEFGSKPRSFYNISAESSLPVNSSVWTRAVVSGHVSSADHPWASHVQSIQGGAIKLAHTCGLDTTNQFIAEGGATFDSRYVGDLNPAASDSIRSVAGETIKTAFFTNFIRNKLDSAAFPKRGSYVSWFSELAGVPNVVSSSSSVAHLKTEISALSAMSAPQDVATLHLSGAFGLLHSFNSSQASSIVDRFFLGGYKDVQGFQYNGLGPHDGQDSVGGDGYIRGAIRIYRKLPTFGTLIAADSPLRFLMFFNGARLVKFDHTLRQPIGTKIRHTLKGPISSACGLGLSYKTAAADFELLYNVPLSYDASDVTSKGWQFSVGLSLP